MPPHARTLLAHLHHLAAPAASDAALLARWMERHDEAAFAELVGRHGPMVLGVCRRVLGDVQHAEDVFQATFLTLARKAAQLRRPEALPSFLYGIALRLARKARVAAARRPLQPNTDISEPADPRPHPLDVLSGRELLALVDEEIARQPQVYRLPLILCLLQERSVEEAARLLGWSAGSVRGRLTRGRERLRQRLSRRGVTLSVGAVALLAPAALPEHLRAAALRNLAAPAPAGVNALTAGSMPKLKAICLGLLVLTAGLGTGLLSLRAPEPPTPAAAAPTAPPARAKNEPRRDLHGDPLPPGAVARLGTLRFRLDTLRVEQVAFTPDGKTLATVSSRGLTLFDVATGKQTKVIKPPHNGLYRIAFSPDGKRLLTCSAVLGHAPRNKMVVQTWDVTGGRKASEAELEYLCWLGWSAKGEPLAVCLGPDEIILHEMATGRKQRFPGKDLPDPPLAAHCHCAVAQNLLVASGANGTIYIWDLTSGKKRYTLQAGVYVMSLALSADGRRLASVSRDAANKNPVQLWDTATGKIVRTLEPAHQVFFAPDGKTLATTTWQEIRFWDVASGRERSRIRTVSYSFDQAVAFSPDGKTFATTEQNSGAIQLWDVAIGTLKPQPQGHTNRPTQSSFSPDGERVATCASMDGTIRVWDLATGEPQVRIHRSGWARDCVFSADGRSLYSCWIHDKLYIDDAASGRELHVLTVEDPERPKFKPSGLALHLSDDRARLTVFHTDDEKFMDMLVTVWDAATHKQIRRRRRVYDAYWNALSADGRTLAAAFAGPLLGQGMPGREMAAGPMHLEDLATGETLLTFPAFKGQTWPLTFSPDGRLLISYTDGPLKSGERGVTLRVWEVLTAAELRSFRISFTQKAAFSPDGRLLAMRTLEGDLLLRDLFQGKEHHRFRNPNADVTSLAFSPDGRRLVSGLSDSTLLVWDVPKANDPANRLDADGAAKAWTDLASADAPRAFRARGAMASSPAEALPLLKEHLRPAQPADAQRLRRLLADLESEQFAVREKAQTALQELGDLAEPVLRQALADKPSLEMRRRVRAVLEHLRGPVTQPELLRSLRAVAVLEDIATPEARRVLETLAAGAVEARQTREAKAALRRLQRRVPAAP